MTEETHYARNRRHPWVAVTLSLIMPGMGHVYCGRIVRGLVLAFLAGISMPVILGMLAYRSPVRTEIFGAAIFAAFVIVMVAVIDSYRIAKRTRTAYELKDYNRLAVYVLLILMCTGSSIEYAFYVREKYLEAFIVPTASNYPTIVPGDRVLANKVAYDARGPQIGDMIVFPYPDNRRINHLKRIVALEGDTVEIEKGELYVNGMKLERQKLDRSELVPLETQWQGDAFYEVNSDARYKIVLMPKKEGLVTDLPLTTVPKHHCFVLGDNRNRSLDSRHYGPLPLVGIIGRVDYLYFPAKEWSRFGRIGN